jgi:prevent-host-death family protein
MSEMLVSIGRVKRDISEMVNRVAYGGQRLVLTSRGKPKAALISYADYQRLQEVEGNQSRSRWEAWRAKSQQLLADILARRQGEPLDLDVVWQAARSDLEARDERSIGG